MDEDELIAFLSLKSELSDVMWINEEGLDEHLSLAIAKTSDFVITALDCSVIASSNLSHFKGTCLCTFCDDFITPPFE